MKISHQQRINKEYAQVILADKVLLLHRLIPLLLGANFLGTIPLSVILWSDANLGMIPVWLAAMGITTSICWLFYRTLDPETATPDRVVLQVRGYGLFAMMAGVLWGIAGWIFFDSNDIASFTFLFVTLIVMVSGSLNPLSSRPVIYVLYSLPAFLPIVSKMLSLSVPFYSWMAVAAIFYLAIMFAFSRVIAASVHDSLLLKYQNQELLGKLRQRTVELEEQTAEAEKANIDKSRFLASASHDLRQPLHAVSMFSEALGAKLSDPEQQGYLNRVQQGLDTLSELLDSLLDISRLDAEIVPVNKKSISMPELCQKLHGDFLPDMTDKGLILESSCEKLFVHSDPVLLERVLRNLLTNAVRYTQQGRVSIRCYKKDDQAEIVVEDTGIGIAEDKLRDIFDEFVQLHNPERDRNKGLGLGLAIVRRISKVLEHPVQVSSELGVGTRFSIQLPLGEVQQIERLPKPVSAIEAKNALKGLQVLVIDNELDILDAMVNTMRPWGCVVNTACSSDGALSLVDYGYRPGFIISDFRMPGEIDGGELISALHEKLSVEDSVSPIPALIISGDTGADIHQKLSDQGLQLLSKPIKPAQLRIAMTRMLNSSLNSAK